MKDMQLSFSLTVKEVLLASFQTLKVNASSLLSLTAESGGQRVPALNTM